MIIKAEIFEGKALLLGADGRVWEVRCDAYDPAGPTLRLIYTVAGGHVIRSLMQPQLAQYIPD